MNIALCGLGKAGRKFIEYTIKDENHELCAVLCRNESVSKGQLVEDITNIKTRNQITVKSIDEFDNSENIDVIVDFSSAPTSLQLVELCCRHKINLVICPTNFSSKELSYISKKAEENSIGIVFTPTLTIGINMLMDFVVKLSSLFPDFSFEIIEKHSKFKSAPTKTATIVADSINRDNVPISSIRLDGYVGEHEVIATNGNERISIVHESFNRNAFACGALVAADYINGKTGYYEIKDIYKELITKFHEEM